MQGNTVGELLWAQQWSADPDTLLVGDLGLIDYHSALALQEEVRDRRIRGELPDVLFLLEHRPVYTLGRGGVLEYRHASPAEAVGVQRVSRGGGMTFHGPGQLVGYPIVDLSRRGSDVHLYLRCLERVLIRVAHALGLAARRIPGQTGVWVGERKLASIGVGMRRWVTMHGFALNVSTDLSYFDAIIPCGLPDVRMTSLMAEGVRVGREEVGAEVVAALASELRYRGVRWLGHKLSRSVETRHIEH